MDYLTKPTNRRMIRQYSKVVRTVFGCKSDSEPFPVLDALEMLPDVIPNANYIIVEDNELPDNVFAWCYQEGDGYRIEIKQTVYDGAYQNNPVFRCFICHEICHVMLFSIGFTPISAYSVKENEVPPYCSVEWQAKALCGEVMIPFEATIGMKPKEIMEKYNVTEASAKYRRKMEKKTKQAKSKRFFQN